MPSRVVADDVWEEMLKYVVLAVAHFPEQSFVSFLSKLLSSGISCTIETKPYYSADERSYALFI